ncbi:DNA-3-methyladenine glycosylase 2 family protein [filamentous cyanobacterium LEGE 11480]|uniref:DNA-3-methyladenine glycosylase II n=1 Tax=Romeriopsis navalis LEGE 11480 TaxID=2777977 RepID=A0A928Z0Q1_9CYAN|nr:DNA-3-methyladenine glycosylase 2 family protein [Romeriopsis navalis]MBE9028501.1 DNA-3-methyladenine glycosylase 2 family protein [Romeriopsis navalis LEGE 11480]
MVNPLDLGPIDHTLALQHLQRADPKLAQLIQRFGPCELGQSPVRDSVLSALVKSIIFQRISIKAANTVYQRFLALYPGGFPAATLILQTADADLRAIGLPPAKVSYLKDLAQHVLDGLPAMSQLVALSDAEIIRILTQIKGIGEWSVQMLLMFQLQRWDVMPYGDVGLQLAMRDLYQLSDTPKKVTMQPITASWRPYRTIGCWYLWRNRDAASQAILAAFERQ